MTEHTFLSDDWARNWQGSIAVKITSVVLWVVMVVAFSVSVFALRDLDGEISEKHQAKADQLAHRVTQIVAANPKVEEAELGAQLFSLRKGTDFSAIRLRRGASTLYVGRVTPDSVPMTREIPVAAGTASVTLDAYHRPVATVVRNRRNMFILALFVSLLLFGVLLAWYIRTVVHRPLAQLVAATRAISRGREHVRLDTSRGDEFGHLSRFFNRMVDRLIAQRHDLEVALSGAQRASRLRSAFLANMSHELRTPLNAIIGYSELLEEEARDTGLDACLPDLKQIRSSGKHLLALINEVLEYSKLEAGRVEVRADRFDVAAMMAEVEATVRPLMAENDNVFEVYYDPTIGFMNSDQTKLRQVLVNLLSNAAKFTERGMASLTVTRGGSEEEPWLVFAVKDDGIGIAKDKIDRLFRDFTQIDSSPSRRFGGTGLGLAISKRYSELLGGRIEVKSAKGEGSTFTLHLPEEFDSGASLVTSTTGQLLEPAEHNDTFVGEVTTTQR